MDLKGADVLILDDDPTVRALTSKILREAGVHPIEAESVPEAIERAVETHPHLVICDLVMPGESGFEFLEKRRAIPALLDVPVLILSAKRDRASVYKAISLGAADYVIKPLDPAALVQKIARLLKDASFGKLAFHRKHRPAVSLEYAGTVTAASETGLLVESRIRLGSGTRVRIGSRAIEELGLTGNALKTSPRMMPGAADGGSGNELILVGVRESLSQRLRTILSQWKMSGKETAVSGPSAAPAVKGRPRAVLIDDDLGFTKLMAATMKPLGIEVHATADPAEFRGWLETWKPDLGLIDLQLGELSGGFELVTAAKKLRGADFPVMIVSGRSDTNAIAQSLELGASDFLIKPVAKEMLTAKISRFLTSAGVPAEADPYVRAPGKGYPARIVADLQASELDELGFTFTGGTVFAKGTELTARGKVVDDLLGAPDSSIPLNVASTWVNVDGKTHGAYLEFVGLPKETIAGIRRWLREKRAAEKD